MKIYYLLITVSITEGGFFINTRRVSGFAKSNHLKKLIYLKISSWCEPKSHYFYEKLLGIACDDC